MRHRGPGWTRRTHYDRQGCKDRRPIGRIWRHSRRRKLVWLSGASTSRIVASDRSDVQDCRHDETTRKTAGRKGIGMSRFTVAKAATLEGIGLHLGKPCRLTFKPASSGSGIRFRRLDLANAAPISATVNEVSASERRTQLGTGEN